MMDQKAKIYVAGHNGLVGSAIVRELRRRGYGNIIVRSSKEVDLCRQNAVDDFFAAERPEYVFLAAAKVGGIIANSTYTADFIYDNIMIASNVIHASYRFGAKKLLNLGSSCIYPRLAPQPMKEEHLLTGLLEPTNEPYAVAKIAAIKLCRYFNQQYGTNFISAMPTNMYGLQDNFDLEKSHVLPAMIRKFVTARLLAEGKIGAVKETMRRLDKSYTGDYTDSDVRGYLARFGISERSVTLWGTGAAYREFLFNDDLADACVFLMENASPAQIGECINVGSQSEVSIRELAALVSDVVGFSGDVVWDASKPDGSPRKLMDSSRIAALGWKPKVALREGIEAVVKTVFA